MEKPPSQVVHKPDEDETSTIRESELDVLIQLENRKRCDVYIENWQSMTTINDSSASLKVGYYLFPDDSTKITLWLAGNDYYCPSIVEISRSQSSPLTIRFKRKAIKVKIVVADEKGPVDGFLQSDDLYFKGAKIGDPEVRDGEFERLIDVPKDNEFTVRFFNPDLNLGRFQVEANFVKEIPSDEVEIEIPIVFSYDIEKRRRDEEKRLKKEEERIAEQKRRAE
ncbi:hypothetical protein MJD09_08945, partial [bacterium]|nr:hypothetical protein [bacterium]